MGRPKALIPWNGRPLWVHQLDTLQRLKPDRLFLSAPRGWDLPGCEAECVSDAVPGLGPVGGLVAALRAAPEGFLVALAIDMPEIPSEFLWRLLDLCGPHGLVPEVGGFHVGLAAVYPVAILPIAERILESDDRSLQHLVRAAVADGLVRGYQPTPAECGFFRNLNEPRDLPE